MPASPSSARMVGRDAELDALTAALADGRVGVPRAVVVRGEAGIGKTRLIAELIARAREGRMATGLPLVVATGQCVDLGPIGAPFTPIRRLLHELWVAVGDEAFRDAARTPAVVATLSTLVPELSDLDQAPPAGAGDYVTEAVERIVENLSADHQLLLVIEDLHWADAATLALLKTLASTLRGAHVTIVMSYRSDDVGRGHPLRPVLAELDRSRVVTSLEVKRLNAEGIALQVELLTGRRPSPHELDGLTTRSEGVPFFVEELVSLAGDALPDTLRDLVLARYEALSGDTRAVMRLMAAGGTYVDHTLLESVFAGVPGELDDAVREALTANLIVSDRAGYGFRHALIAEAIHDELLPSERVELHSRYAAELQRRADAGEPALAATIAEHWLIARDNVRAFEATAHAYAEARAGYASISQARLGERLLELWPQVPDAQQRLGLDRGALCLELATLEASLNEYQRGLRIVDEGLAAIAPDAVSVRAALLSRVGMMHDYTGKRELSEAALREALALIEGSELPEDLALQGRVIAQLTRTRPEWSPEGAEQLFDRAVDLVTRFGEAVDISAVLGSRATVHGYRGETDAAITDLQRSVSVETAPDDRLHSISNLVDALGRAGRFDEAIEVGEGGIADSLAVGLERGYGAFIISNVAESYFYVGRPEPARRYAQRAAELLVAVPPFLSFALRQLVLQELWDGESTQAAVRRAEAVEAIAAVSDDIEEPVGWAVVDVDAALIAFESSGDAAERARHAAAAMAAATILDRSWATDSPGLTLRVLPSAALAVAAGRAAGADAAVEALRSLVLAASAALAADRPAAGVRAFVSAALNEADAAGMAPAAAAGGWRDAVAAAEAGFVPRHLLHLARYRLASALVESGERDEAAQALAAILAEAPEQGADTIAQWAAALARRAGLEVAGASAASGVVRDASGLPTLTARELQVLELVAQGLTNPQIGKQLFISPKTASVHVSAILAKIGAANRAEAASLFAQTGNAAPRG